ncbi:unnamed protein product [Caenorhabditis nigoni]
MNKQKGKRQLSNGFVVFQIISNSIAFLFSVDTNGDEIEGIFYTRELTKCTYDPNAVYRIEKVLDTRVWKGMKQSLVKWEGYPDSFACWINTDSLITV